CVESPRWPAVACTHVAWPRPPNEARGWMVIAPFSQAAPGPLSQGEEPIKDSGTLNLSAVGHARGARPATRIHMFAASRGFGAGAGDPFGRSNMPLGRLSKKASTSDVFTTSAYLAFMSQRLMAWLACERSKQPSSARAMR